MTDDRIEVSARVVGSGPITFLTEDLAGGRFEPPAGSFVFDGVRIIGVDFSGLELNEFKARGSLFERCDFSRARFRRSGLGVAPTTIYRDCQFERTDLRGSSPGVARFERCTFDHARLDGWRMSATEFVGCRFSGTLRRMEFGAHPVTSAVLRRQRNEIRDNDFREADLRDVEFLGGVDLDAQLWPDDPSYLRLDVRPETLDRLDRLVDRLPPDERSAQAEYLRWVRGRFAGQATVLVRDDEWERYRRLLRLAQGN